jgi:protein-S-isoprenylcysteine O-methyltransferase Ste14
MSPESRVALIRSAALLVPCMAAAVAWLWRVPERRHAGGIFLATLWTLPALVAVNVLAIRQTWWSFSFRGGAFFGLPLDLLLGWALLWGAIPAILLTRAHLAVVALVLGGLDVLLMPLCAPVVKLGPHWLAGELLAIAVVLLPAQCLARWMRNRTRLAGRVTLQVATFCGLMLWLIPSVVLSLTGQRWPGLRSASGLTAQVLVQLAIVVAAFGLSAVQEFAVRGGGTPFPYDPPLRLVTSGTYAYVRNPMQLVSVLFFLLFAAWFRNGWFAAGAVVSFAYAEGFAKWDETDDLRDRFGDRWEAYRLVVRRWLPRWRPYVPAEATLYVAATCDICRAVGRWLQARAPIGLRFVPAEAHASKGLLRIRYESAEGDVDEGVAAVARVLEHIHLGWALLGLTARLPLVRPLIQLIVDAMGGGPRPLIRA